MVTRSPCLDGNHGTRQTTRRPVVVAMVLLAALVLGSGSAVEAVDGEAVFSDVPPDHVFAAEIAWLASTGITQGRGDGSFGVEDAVSRGAMAAFLHRVEGEPDVPLGAPRFPDVPDDHVFAEAIAWLASTGITQGRDDGRFGIEESVTRGAMAAFLARFAIHRYGALEEWWAATGQDDVQPDLLPEPWVRTVDGWQRARQDPAGLGGDGLSRMGAVVAVDDGFRAVGFVGDRPALWSSEDGRDWERRTSRNPAELFTMEASEQPQGAVAWDGGLLVYGADFATGAAAVWRVEDDGSWRRVRPDAPAFASLGSPIMASMVAGGPGLVAVGSERGALGDRVAVWVSTDGEQWSRIDRDDDVLQGGRASDVIRTGQGLVAVGTDTERDSAAVWTSADGWSWQRVPHTESVFGGPGLQRMQSVTTGGPGLVAVGWDHGQEAIAVWTSVDGRSWQRVSHDAARFGLDMAEFLGAHVIDGPSGLVAIADGDIATVVWTSTDGREWQRVDGLDQDGAAFDDVFNLHGVAADDTGLVAVGERGFQLATVWTSQDGVSWERIPHDRDVFGGTNQARMLSVTARAAEQVAVGFDLPGWQPGETVTTARAAAWTSDDGLRWERILVDDPATAENREVVMRAVTTAGPGYVAVGDDATPRTVPRQRFPVVWTSPDGRAWSRVQDAQSFGEDSTGSLFAVVAGGPGVIAVGSDAASASAAVWTSSNGLSWQQVDLHLDVHPDTVWTEFRDVIVHDAGMIAVGYEQRSSAGASGDGWMAAAVWTSTDAERWERVPHEPALFGGSSRIRMTAVSEGGDGFVAAGYHEDREHPVVWTSSDGRRWERVDHDLDVFRDGAIEALVGVGEQVVAVGRRGGAAGFWSSPDGRSWQVLQPTDPSLLWFGDARAAVAFDGEVVAVGGDPGWQSAAAWRGPVE